MRIGIFVIIFTLIFLPATTKTGAQSSEPKLYHIGLENGLSQSTIYCITQDARGFMWFGTQDGLNCFDGYNITIYKHKEGGSNSISDNTVSCLLSDPPYNIWIGTFKGGLNRYSLSEDKFYNYPGNADIPGSVSGIRITVLFRDSRGNIWAGSSNGLDRFDRNDSTFIHYYAGKDTVMSPLKHINAICEDKAGRIWVGSRDGLFNISGDKVQESNQFSQFEISSGDFFSDPVSAAYSDHDGRLWIGLENKTLVCYDESLHKVIQYGQSVKGTRPIMQNKDGTLLFGSLFTPGLRVLNPESGQVSMLSDAQNDLVNAIFIDNSDIVWFGTFFHGVFSYDLRNNRFKHFLDNPQNPDVVMSILEDRKGGLWFGTFGNGLKYLKNNRSEFVTYQNDPDNSNTICSNKVLALEEEQNGSIWIGMIGGGLDLFEPHTGRFRNYRQRNSANTNGLSSNDVTAVYKDKKGNLWIGYYSGQIDMLDHSNGKFVPKVSRSKNGIYQPDATVTIFREDESGNLWIGTHGNGLLSYQYSTGKFKKHNIRISPPHSGSRTAGQGKNDKSTQMLKGVSSLCISSKGMIWLGSDESGLIKYNPFNGSSVSYKLMDDADNTIYGLLPDSSGCLWLSTNKGLLRFDTTSARVRLYDKYDGLQANEFDQGAYYKNTSGELFFGGVNGVNSFVPSRIEDNDHIPPVYITSFKVFDKVIPLPVPITSATKIELSYSQNYFSFEFVALNYTLPEKNKYAYILKGFDHNWHNVSSHQRFASYTNLDPGEYHLVVKASNNDGVWNEKGTDLIIVINPPYWMTWWFRGLLILVIISTAYAIYRYRIIQLLKMERMRLRIATDLHDELGSDLSAIALASQMTNGRDESDQGRLSKIRQNSLRAIESMREIVWFIQPEHDSPEKLIEKMKDAASVLLEGKEYDFVVRNNVSRFFQDIKSRQNLFMIFKETLTNIVRHSDCEEVEIELGSNDGNRLLRIYDNGKGFDPDSVKKGSGLNSLKMRADRLHMIIKISSKIENGTTVELFLPK